MVITMRSIVIAGAGALLPLAYATVVSAGVARAAECGPGTFYDAPTNTCLAAPLPPPPPPPPPGTGDPTPGFSIGVCAPIPFVSLCTGI